MKQILVIHGPNLNLLGQRDTSVYGTQNFETLNGELMRRAEGLGLSCEICQSNHEGVIIDRIQAAKGVFDGIILNAGAYTHYSYAIHDAIADSPLPVVEVHISNIFGREEFRAKSVLSPVCAGTIAGFGLESYYLALHYFADQEEMR